MTNEAMSPALMESAGVEGQNEISPKILEMLRARGFLISDKESIRSAIEHLEGLKNPSEVDRRHIEFMKQLGVLVGEHVEVERKEIEARKKIEHLVTEYREKK